MKLLLPISNIFRTLNKTLPAYIRLLQTFAKACCYVSQQIIEPPMALSDKEFREEFKPLQIPAAYKEAGSRQDKILFVLAQLGEATSAEVFQKLGEMEPGIKHEQSDEEINEVLSGLFDKGLLNGGEQRGQMYYNLSKITQANKGTVDPELLEP